MDRARLGVYLPGEDHLEIWRDVEFGEFKYITFHPYHFTGQTARELLQVCDALGLEFDVSAYSWHCLARTTRVTIQRKCPPQFVIT